MLLPPTIEENAPSILSPPHSNTDDGKPCSPFLAQWFVPMIELIIKSCPNSSNKGLKEVLKVYANDYAMTKSILQKARTLACKEMYGEARVNAKYILALQDELELRGHFVEVILTNQQDAIYWMMLAALAEEVRRRKATKQKSATSPTHMERGNFAFSGTGIMKISSTSTLVGWRIIGGLYV